MGAGVAREEEQVSNSNNTHMYFTSMASIASYSLSFHSNTLISKIYAHFISLLGASAWSLLLAWNH